MEHRFPTVPGPDPADLLWVAARPVDRRGRAVVSVVGEVDAYTAPLLDSCLRGQCAREGLRTLVVDLTGVRVLSSAGLALLEDAAERCAGRGARLVVRAGGQPTVHPARALSAASAGPRDTHAGRGGRRETALAGR